ncbi:MAG: deoxyguanosinetriphosphate triphosphohydrolase family protein [Alphaproteobacteria bacterium]
MTRALYRANDKKRLVKIKRRKGTTPEPYRSVWRRDYARLIHSAAFRRLQGKTQLFPNHESDFFRNRLTHSLEVAQIAKSIGIKINNTETYFKKHPIDVDLLELAGLAHDLGHPPFGHNGEAALDECMQHDGGFEGNAQTLRIISTLEKRQTRLSQGTLPVQVNADGKDIRAGLNLCYRSLASVLKYDHQIARERDVTHGLQKGYYYTEREVVQQIKRNVCGDARRKNFKTVECQIMDIAGHIHFFGAIVV